MDTEQNTGQNLKANPLETWVGATIMNSVEAVTNLFTNAMAQSLNVFKQAVQYENTVFQASMEQASAVIQNSLQTVVGGFSKTANEIGQDALKARMAEAKANVSAMTKARSAEMALENLRTRAVYSQTKILVDTVASQAKTNTEFIENVSKMGGGMFNSVMDKLANVAGDGGLIVKAIGEAGQVFGTAVGLGAKLQNLTAQQNAKLIGAAMDYDLEMLEINKIVYDTASEQFQSILDKSEKIVSEFTQLYSDVRKTVEVSDTASRKLAVQMGYYGRQGDIYAKSMMSTAESVAKLFGRTTEQILSMQNAYIAASGRNVGMTAEDYENMIGVGRAFGMGDEETAQLMGNMNVFNMSVESGADMMGRMYHTVTKMGLSASKFARDLSNNLRLAQKYNFKGGVENLAKMTQWAEQTRFNLNAATAMSDRIMGGDLSNLVETAAKLQVLGGSAAIYADPIAMLYEAGADVGQLARRQAAMFNDITGRFNKLTGETEFTWFENMLIRQRALAAGMSEEDAKNMIRQRHRQVEIDNALRGSELDAETRTAIGNRATFNQKTQKWEVTDVKGKKHDVDELKYNKALIENLLPENKDEAILTVAQKSLGFAEKQTIYQAWLVQHFGAMNYDEVRAASDRMLAAEKAYYARNEGNVNKNLGFIIEATAEATEHQYANMEANAASITQVLRNYLTIMNRLTPITSKNISQIAATTSELSRFEDGLGMVNYIIGKVTTNASMNSVSSTGVYEGGVRYFDQTYEEERKWGRQAHFDFREFDVGPRIKFGSYGITVPNKTEYADVAAQGVANSASAIPETGKDAVKATKTIVDKTWDAVKGMFHGLGETFNRFGDWVESQWDSQDAMSSGGIIGGRPAATKAEGTADNIPIKVSVGEYVVNAEAAREHRELLDAINYGSLSKTSDTTGAKPSDRREEVRVSVTQPNTARPSVSDTRDTGPNQPSPEIGDIHVTVAASDIPKPTVEPTGGRNTIEPSGRMQAPPTPSEASYEPIGRLERSFMSAISSMESRNGPGGTIDVSMNNSISVDGMSAHDILSAIADAITRDPAGASALQKSLDQLGDMEYRMNYGKTV